jgi:hypothetical protein
MYSRPSSLALILANLVPLAGVLYFSWSVLDILLLYWAESVVIGIVNVLRMVTSRSDNILAGMLPEMTNGQVSEALMKSMPRINMPAFKLFLVPFFAMHYGGFCYGHLMAVIGLFSGSGLRGGITPSLVQFWQPEFWIAVGAIAASHLYSFGSNFIGEGEYKNASLIQLMNRPYGRIITMHVAIVLGAGLVMWLGTPLPTLVILIAGKIAIDLRLHEAERVKLAAS